MTWGGPIRVVLGCVVLNALGDALGAPWWLSLALCAVWGWQVGAWDAERRGGQ